MVYLEASVLGPYGDFYQAGIATYSLFCIAFLSRLNETI